MHTFGGQGTRKGDDFKLPSQDGGAGFARALKCRLGKIPDNAQYETATLLVGSQRLQADTHVITRLQVQRLGDQRELHHQGARRNRA
jgi:hypothetical protein